MQRIDLKEIKLMIALFSIFLTAFFILGCSSSGGDSPQTYSASGTYIYDEGLNTLTATFTYSEFPGCGPDVGVETYSVNSISATTMVWNEGEEDMLTWVRDSGVAGDITGTWDYIDEGGNAYETNIDPSGTISLIADIVDCSDGNNGGGMQCNIDAIVMLPTGSLLTGATVTADGKSCTTSSGTCTINNVAPCGGVLTVTASYPNQDDVSENVTTYPNGGTSVVQLKFEPEW